MLKNEQGQYVESPVHIWFGLTYSNYFVIPRMAMEAMPLDWQRRFVALMDEASDTGIETPVYHVLRDDPEYTREVLEDPDDELSAATEYVVLRKDPWANYRRPDDSLLPLSLQRTVQDEREES